jgi:hypothetical protein
MATYAFKGRGAALPYDTQFSHVLKRKVDLPALVATDYGKLALAATPTVGLTSFSGMVQNDILELWEVPAGTLVKHVGVRVSTAEGATAAADIGNASATETHLLTADADGYMGTIDLNSATVQTCLVADAQLGADNYMGVCFVTAGSINMTFTTDDTYAAAIFDVWAEVVGPVF